MRIHEQDPGAAPQGHRPARRPDDEAAAGALAAMAAGAGGAVSPSAVLGLQRAAGNASVSDLLGGEEEQESPVKDVVGSGGGQPLDDGTREFMESRLGHDFGDVRVHTDSKATESAKAVQAHAYTMGNDVVFQRDQYAPDTSEGKRMLAHELTHVVQQRSGPVDGTPAPGGISVSDPSDAFEQAAERTADQVMSSGPLPAGAAAGSGVQREAAEKDELQTSAVQRQEGEELEEEELQTSAVQRQEEEEELQMSAVQRQEEEEIPEEEAPGG